MSVELNRDSLAMEAKKGLQRDQGKQPMLVRSLEKYFAWHGRFVARHPWPVIGFCLLVTSLFSLGLTHFHWESNAIKLWMPTSSDFVANYLHMWEHNPPDFRMHSIIFVADNGKENILQPKYLQQMYDVRAKLYEVQTEDGQRWIDECLKIPIAKVDLEAFMSGNRRRRRRDVWDNEGLDSDFFDSDFENNFKDVEPSVSFYPDPFCNIIEDLDEQCLESSILELWASKGSFDSSSRALMGATNMSDISRRLASNFSKLFLIDRDFSGLLGGVELDAKGHVKSAKAAMFKFMGLMNGTAAKLEKIGYTDARGEWVDAPTRAMESALISTLANLTREGDHFEALLNVQSSFSQIASSTIFSDVTMVAAGFAIVFFYALIQLGQFHRILARVYLSLLGLLAVYFSIGASWGLCNLMGLPFSPLHNFIPFLMLGLGVDDMFVIMQSWNNLPSSTSNLKVSERLSMAMAYSGTAITITSVTNAVVFAIGATTVTSIININNNNEPELPALQSFCTYCAVGIVFLYFMQSTWFVAWMVLDEKRIALGISGWLLCVRYGKEEKRLEVKQEQKGTSLSKLFFKHFATWLMKWPVKVAVVVATVLLAIISVKGVLSLNQEFDPIWFLPRDSYLFRWSEINKKYFPGSDEDVFIFFSDPKLPSDLDEVSNLVSSLKSREDIVLRVDDWYSKFEDFNADHFDFDQPLSTMGEEVFNERLTQFLFSAQGSPFRLLFRFTQELQCGQPAPPIKMFPLKFTHRNMASTSEKIEAMNAVKDLVGSLNFSGRVFPFSSGYATWEVDEVIAKELHRNLVIAFVSIFVITLLLLWNLVASLQVLFCVMLTIVNVAGLMHFWGVKVEVVSCTILVICVGICVDYAAHIAHAFLHTTGKREVRVTESLVKIGPAVLNGAFSTFLSFILLAVSSSHVFETFFKIFFLVVVTAVYNGLVVLPIILSVFGAQSSSSSSRSDDCSGNNALDAEPLDFCNIELLKKQHNSLPQTDV